jgi:hypothetical protein
MDQQVESEHPQEDLSLIKGLISFQWYVIFTSSFFLMEGSETDLAELKRQIAQKTKDILNEKQQVRSRLFSDLCSDTPIISLFFLPRNLG